jgi:hypothetical protein
MILITGMQRSGTSLVCQLLSALGVSFGDRADHIPGDRWNPGGYFELRAVMDVNSLVITGLPRHAGAFATWLSKVAYLRMPSAAAIAARAVRHRGAIEALGERHRDGALKDPRFCLTLRWWRQWAPVQHVVVCLRDPGAVVDSMRRRHGIPQWLGARFYAWHVDTLLDELPHAPAVFVDVDRLVAGDGGELDALRDRLALRGGPASPALLRDVVQSSGFTTDWPPLRETSVGVAAWRRLLAFAAQRAPLARGGTR